MGTTNEKPTVNTQKKTDKYFKSIPITKNINPQTMSAKEE